MSTAQLQPQGKLNCLFWNVGAENRGQLISNLVAEHSVDIVVLAEAQNENSDALLDQLQKDIATSFCCPDSTGRQAVSQRLRILARSPEFSMRELYSTANGRMTIRQLKCFGTEFLFVSLHLPSKVNFTPEDQTANVVEICDQLRAEEKRRGHRRTILVGDLNMNPFETGVVQTKGLHAVMSRDSAEARHRTVQSQQYPFFYNPMWGSFGDRTGGPPGTHYYRHSGHVSYDWNMYDQVLIRPDALPWFDDRIEILTDVGDLSLATQSGRPNREVGSDHFPVLFGLKNPGAQ